jgi:cell shape-determining protein MreC
MTDFRINETTDLLAELAKLSEENKRLRDELTAAELTAADLMADLLERELTDLKLRMGVLT